LCCSDGITEAQDKERNMFEIGQVQALVKENYSKSLQEIGDEIIQKVK